MKQKISKSLWIVAIIVAVFSIGITSYASNEVYDEQIYDDLVTTASALSDNLSYEEISKMNLAGKALRITVIEYDGEVIFDSDVDISQLDNHMSRPEVQEAIENGVGRAVRTSDTLMKNTYYAAIRCEDYILRVSKMAHSIFAVYITVLPFIVIMLILMFVLILAISRILTRSIIAPINQLGDNFNTSNVEVYEELSPFVNKIREQHERILMNANMRQEFTANVSHELKTPLTAITGYAELIKSGISNIDDSRKFAGEIHTNATRLLSLITDIIRLSELDSEGTTITYEEVNLYEIAKTVANSLKLLANKLNVEIKVVGKDSYVYGNREMMHELVYNLCDNAIKYNRENGSVTIYIEEESGRTVLKVCDTGIGISLENQERVFERFYRVDKSRSKKIGGTGLGLAIVKHIVLQHNAEISIESILNRGTEFTVRF
ncbi:MAG: ATP-binding protein [Erysipelotrichales bacterium]|nr:ATP-binding protein [Erysipelotrichales bacterium]